MNDCNCPYCDAEIEINHDDGYGYSEDEVHQQQCSDCGKTFTYTTSISFSYDTEKADCLNGAPHNWKPTASYPKCATKMLCDMCGEYRDMTVEEKIEHKIPTFDEEMKELEIIKSKEVKP